MTTRHLIAQRVQSAIGACLLVVLGGCAALQPGTEPPPTFFALEAPGSPATSGGARAPGGAAFAPSGAITLVVNSPAAAAGFDSQRIVYLRKTHELAYYAHNQWVDTPARMLAPLIVAALERNGAFRAVVHAPGSAIGEMRLETQILRLQHEFLTTPSRVRFTLRATLVDAASRRALATREFDGYADAPSENPYGGVVAANRVTAAVLDDLAAFAAGVRPSRNRD